MLNHLDLLHYLEDQTHAMVDLLERLVSIESPSSVFSSHKPALILLEKALIGSGMATRIVNGSGELAHLYARADRHKHGCQYQLMIGHIDTVWPLGTLNKMPLHRDGEKLHGPGVYDMKAGLVQMVFALKSLDYFKTEPEVTPVAFVNSDEETGSKDSTRTIRWLSRFANRAFILEPSLGPDGMIKTTRKGVGRYTIHVQGKAAHAGLDPEQGASAILELSYQIQKLFELNDHQKGVSVNVGKIDGGLRPNVVAPESTAVVDVRAPNQRLANEVHSKIHSLCSHTQGVEVRVEGHIGRPPMEQSESAEQLWLLAKQNADSIGLEIDQASAGGGSDGNTTSQFTPTLDGLGAVGGGAHAHHEFVQTDQLATRATLLALLLLEKPI